MTTPCPTCGGTGSMPEPEPWTLRVPRGGVTFHDSECCAACGHKEAAHKWDPPEERRRTCTCGCPEYVVRPEYVASEDEWGWWEVGEWGCGRTDASPRPVPIGTITPTPRSTE